MSHQVTPVHPRLASVGRGGSLHWAKAVWVDRGYAGWRRAHAIAGASAQRPRALMKHPG